MGVSLLNSWRKTEIYNSTSWPLPSYSVSAGSNRLLVVVAQWEHSEDENNAVMTIKYGGQTMTKPVNAGVIKYGSQGSTIAYLNEAGISAASSSNFSVTFDRNPKVVNFWVCALANVDQSTPITDTDKDELTDVVLGTRSVSLTRVSGGYAIVGFNTGRNGDFWDWNNEVTDLTGTTTIECATSVAVRFIYNSGTETISALYADAGMHHWRFVSVAAMVNPAATSIGADVSISEEASAAESFDSSASTEDIELSETANVGASFFPIQEGDEEQYTNQFFYKGQILYADTLNRMSDNIRLVRTNEVSSRQPINKEAGAFFLDVSNTTSYRMSITGPDEQMIVAFSIDPVLHKPDFSPAMGGNQFEDYSIKTTKFGSGQLTDDDFADNAFTSDKIYNDSQSRFAAGAIGSGTLGKNSVTTTKISSGAIHASAWALSTASVSGSSSGVTITLNKFSLCPDFRSSSNNMRLAGHNQSSDRNNPKIKLDGDGSSYSYDVAWNYLLDT